ncbi:unnamed protein product [Mytilus edulis]|uniref:Endonuclease n=1 Tax=Mytilus edulis TaxID=6550 RepID=A0A8S3QF51_MYTED|nr:unnamed protein product [Mytilus edulis]
MIEVDNREHNFNNVHKAKFGKYQALDIDYKDSGYDRGHLNPQIFNTQNKNSRYATNTLTNIAPQYGPFNQVTWNIMENGLVNALRNNVANEYYDLFASFGLSWCPGHYRRGGYSWCIFGTLPFRFSRRLRLLSDTHNACFQIYIDEEAGRGRKVIEVDNLVHNLNNVHNAKFGQYQALDIDFKDSGYNRGHLNSKIFNTQNENSRYATNTLTNIAPQYGPFNQGTWNIMENSLVNAVRDKCRFPGAKSYVVIGVQPSNDKFITRTIEKTVTTSRGKQKTKNEYENSVNIPDFYWTAICCDTSMVTNHTDMGWSFGYKANNINEKSVLVSFYPIHNFLSNQYSQIFVQGCEFNRNNTIRIIKYIKNSIKQGPIFEENPTERFET